MQDNNENSEPEDDVVSFLDIINDVSEKLKGVCDRLDRIEKDLAFVKEKSDQIGLKSFHINKKIDEMMEGLRH